MVIGQCVSGFGSIKDNHIYEIGKRILVYSLVYPITMQNHLSVLAHGTVVAARELFGNVVTCSLEVTSAFSILKHQIFFQIVFT